MKRKSTAVSLLLLSLTNPTTPCSIAASTKFTAYGYPDADGIPAYACKGSQPISSSAGGKTMLGDGSFEKPYAAAAASGSVFQECELVYVPLLKKYFRIQDNCGACGRFFIFPGCFYQAICFGKINSFADECSVPISGNSVGADRSLHRLSE